MQPSLAQKFAIQKKINADPDLSPLAKLIAYVLIFEFHNSKTGQCNPSIEALCRAVSRKRSAVSAALATLIGESGWFIQRRGRGSPSYSFQPGRLQEVQNLVEFAGQDDRKSGRLDVRKTGYQKRKAVRKSGPETGDDIRDSGCLDVRDPGHRTDYLNITPLNPPTEQVATARGGIRKAFVPADSELWGPLQERFKREHGKTSAPRATSPDHGNKTGWWFPVAWIDQASEAHADAGPALAEAARASG